TSAASSRTPTTTTRPRTMSANVPWSPPHSSPTHRCSSLLCSDGSTRTGAESAEPSSADQSSAGPVLATHTARNSTNPSETATTAVTSRRRVSAFIPPPSAPGGPESCVPYRSVGLHERPPRPDPTHAPAPDPRLPGRCSHPRNVRGGDA